MIKGVREATKTIYNPFEWKVPLMISDWLLEASTWGQEW